MDDLRIFAIHRDGSTVIVAPTGPISNLAAHEVQAEVDQIIALLQDDQWRNVVIDMEKVSFFGSVMLGAMHTFWKIVRRREGRLVLCRLADVGREIIHVAKFDTVWPIYATRQEALEALKTPPS